MRYLISSLLILFLCSFAAPIENPLKETTDIRAVRQYAILCSPPVNKKVAFTNQGLVFASIDLESVVLKNKDYLKNCKSPLMASQTFLMTSGKYGIGGIAFDRNMKPNYGLFVNMDQCVADAQSNLKALFPYVQKLPVQANLMMICYQSKETILFEKATNLLMGSLQMHPPLNI